MEIHKNDSQLVDLVLLRNLLGDHEEGIVEILNIFTSHIPPSIAKIKTLLEKKDWGALRNNVHAIKSYYGYIGNDKLNQMLNEWDAALTRNQPDIDHHGIMVELEIKSEAIVQRIQQMLLNDFAITPNPPGKSTFINNTPT
jgi:HPt (histidine-containing phosphotransfer) domain-containing protein